MLEVEALRCVRNDIELFAGLSLAVQAGQAVQIQGANGCGKTSLLRILSGLSLAEAGEVRWRGENIERVRADYLANIAYIGHANGIKEDLSALENLRFARALSEGPRTASAEQALAEVGLADRADVACGRLSAGQRRRVALARLLLTDVPLWILDEPFTALDSAAIHWVERLLQQHVAARGMLLLTTHRPADLGACSVATVALDAVRV